MNLNIETVKKYLNENNIDAWIIYQFIDLNPTFNKVVGKDLTVTRRTFLIIDKEGETSIIHSTVDGGLSSVGVKEITYTSYDQFKTVAKENIGKFKKIAMEYSPMSMIPHISRVDAGVIDFIRSLGVEVVSSGDLMQYTLTLSDEEIQSHMRAAKELDRIRKETFDFIKTNFRGGKPVTEYDVMKFILDKTEEAGLETVYEPTVNFNENSSKTHYQPSKEESKILKEGDFILVDLWLKEKKPEAIYADIAWVLNVGPNVNPKIQNVFDTLRVARDNAIAFMKETRQKGESFRGWEVDNVAQEYIRSKNLYDFIAHRLGHSIGTFIHGQQTHLDNFENKDERIIVPNHLTSVEPGIVIPGEFGMHLEVDVLVTENDAIVTTEKQDEIYII